MPHQPKSGRPSRRQAQHGRGLQAHGAEGSGPRRRALGSGAGRSPPRKGGRCVQGQRGRAGAPPEGAGGRRLVPAPAPVPVPVPVPGPGPGPGEGAETLSQRRGAAGEGRGGPGGAPSPGGAREGSGPRPPGRRAGRCPPWPLLISPV